MTILICIYLFFIEKSISYYNINHSIDLLNWRDKINNDNIIYFIV